MTSSSCQKDISIIQAVQRNRNIYFYPHFFSFNPYFIMFCSELHVNLGLLDNLNTNNVGMK